MLDPEIASRRNDIRDLKAAIDAYILESEENYEDEDYKLTRVQGFRRHWDTAKLEKILPRGIFKNIVTVQADPQKIDQYVREGTLKLKVIAPAFVEIPNAAYVKMTKKSPQAEKGEAEAGSLAEALG